MKKFWKACVAAAMAALLGTVVFTGCAPRTPGTDDGGGNGPIDGGIGTQAITLYIESAAPLKYNYNSLLKTEPEGSQTYNQALFTQTLVEGFKELYPNIELRFIEDGWGDALWQQQQLYIRQWQQGQKPQLDILIGETYMGYMAENGVFAELDSSKFTDVVEGTYADMVVDGKMYGVPMWSGVMGLQYNTAILEEAGIPEEDWEPATWSDLLDNCKTVSEYAEAHDKSYEGIVMNNVRGMSSAFRALPFMRAAGGDFLNDSGDFALSSAENIEAFEYLRELAQYAYSPALSETNEDTVQYLFNQGNGAYFVEGQWSMIDAGETISSCELPATDDGGTGNCYVSTGLFGIAQWSENKAAAQAFLEYLTSAKIQEALYELDGRLPVNKTYLQSDEIRTVQPNMNSYIDTMIEGGFGGGLPSITTNSNTVWERWGTFYNAVLTSSDSVATLAAAADSEINSML